MLVRFETSCLLVVDVQEKLAPVMADPRRVIHNCTLLMRAARRLGVPTVVTEQYPQGIGETIFDLREWLPEDGAVSKLHFSAAAEPEVTRRLEAFSRPQVVVAGIEAHICVLQSALGLKARGYDVFVVADACSSRREANAQLAFERLRGAGVGVVGLEMVLFEWLHLAGTPEFKELVALIK